jgi:glycosyltransferase involved in cell wall biosynthesis
MRAGQAPGPWDGLIVLCAANGYDTVKMSDRHVAEHLSRLAPVLYADPPRSLLVPLRRAAARRAGADIPAPAPHGNGPGLAILGPRLARVTPVVQPFPSRPGVNQLTSAAARRYLHRASSRLGGRVRALISGWPQFPVFGSCGELVRVYWAKDDFVGGAGLLGLNARVLAGAERRVAAAADLVVASSPVVAQAWRERGLPTVLIPFGTDVDAYAGVDEAVPPADARLPAPVAGFIGRLNDRTDLRLLEAVAARGRSLLLVGPKDPRFQPERVAALLARPNVRWVGQKPFGALPGYLRVIDVGLVPYGDSAFNRGSFPLKTLEYLAAGRAVAATDLPAIRWLATGLISVASDPGAFADQVDRLLAEPRTPALLQRRRAFAARHSWQRRAAELNEVIGAWQRDLAAARRRHA